LSFAWSMWFTLGRPECRLNSHDNSWWGNSTLNFVRSLSVARNIKFAGNMSASYGIVKGTQRMDGLRCEHDDVPGALSVSQRTATWTVEVNHEVAIRWPVLAALALASCLWYAGPGAWIMIRMELPNLICLISFLRCFPSFDSFYSHFPSFSVLLHSLCLYFIFLPAFPYLSLPLLSLFLFYIISFLSVILSFSLHSVFLSVPTSFFLLSLPLNLSYTFIRLLFHDIFFCFFLSLNINLSRYSTGLRAGRPGF
jgi:hypothetical protein